MRCAVSCKGESSATGMFTWTTEAEAGVGFAVDKAVVVAVVRARRDARRARDAWATGVARREVARGGEEGPCLRPVEGAMVDAMVMVGALYEKEDIEAGADWDERGV